MREFMILMKGTGHPSGGGWGGYIETLIRSGKFAGGSSLGDGIAVSKDGKTGECTITGFMRFSAHDIDEVRALLAGNPLFEAGGEIEILELLKD